MPLFSFDQISKQIEDYKVENLTFSLSTSEIFALVGKEGAEQTLISALATQTALPEYGAVRTTEGAVVRGCFGGCFLPSHFSAKQIDKFHTALGYGWDSALFYHLLTHFSLPLENFRQDQHYILGFCTTLSQKPDIIVLNPPNSLSDEILIELIHAVREHLTTNPACVLLSCGDSVVLCGLSDQFLYLKHGKTKFIGKTNLVSTQYGVVSLHPSTLEQVHHEDYVCTQIRPHCIELLVVDHQDFNGRYPTLQARPTTLAQTLWLLENGVMV